MSVQIKRTSAISSLSITPLIDVVFLLLIFFLVTSRFSEEERELDLNLPSVTEALPASIQPDELIINVDKEGRYYINGAFRQVEQVEQITFSGSEALRRGQEVVYVTERAVFQLSEQGLVLTDVAPGVDVSSDVVERMQFKPHISGDLKLMKTSHFNA